MAMPMAMSRKALQTIVCTERARSRLQRGFTLLEVLIGLLVLALALLALMRTAALQVDGFAALRAHTIAGWLAQDLLAETRIGNPFPPTGSSSGRRRFGNGEWRWEVRVQGTDVATIHRIDVRVYSSTVGETEAAQLTGFAGQDLQP
jgi:general secretion pathway protein I